MHRALEATQDAISDITVTVGDTTIKVCAVRMFAAVLKQLDQVSGGPAFAMTPLLVVHQGDTRVAGEVLDELNDALKAQCATLRAKQDPTPADFTPAMSENFALGVLAAVLQAVSGEIKDLVDAALDFKRADDNGHLSRLASALSS